jgi:hypothetical protein
MSVITEMVAAHERSIRGSNGDMGLVAKQEYLEKEQTRQGGMLSEHQTMLCDPEKGISVQLKALNIFMESAQKFINDFRDQSNRLVLGVAASVVAGLVLQLVLNYVIAKSQTP